MSVRRARWAAAAQIFAVGRQALSLVAGGAIDMFLAGKMRLLRQEHTLARAIHAIQAALWPGGTWFMYCPGYRKRPVRCPSCPPRNLRLECEVAGVVQMTL